MKSDCKLIPLISALPICLLLVAHSLNAALPEALRFARNADETEASEIPTFPDRPAELTSLAGDRFSIRQNDGWGTLVWIRGHVQFPETGDYRFHISGGDHAELWLSQDATPEQAELLTEGPNFLNPGLFGPGSAPVTVRKTEIRYFEIRQFKSGPTHLKVGWTKPNGTQEFIPASVCFPFPGNRTPRRPGLPDGIPQWDPRFPQPEMLSVNEATPITLSPSLAGGQPMRFQWYRDDILLEGETCVSLDHHAVLGDDGSVWELRVENDLGTSSFLFPLKVLPDTEAPTIESLTVTPDSNGLLVRFKEDVDPETALNLVHYQPVAGNFEIAAAEQLQPSLIRLVGLSPLTSGEIALEVSGIKDTSQAGNPMPNQRVELDDTLPNLSFLIFEDLMPAVLNTPEDYPITKFFQETRFPHQPTEIVVADSLSYSSTEDAWAHPGLTRAVIYTSGYITAPVSGRYQFYMAASDESFFRLSPDDSPDNLPSPTRPSLKARCCAPLGYTTPFGPTRITRTLEAGKRYYFDIVHPIYYRPGWLEVGWITPGGSDADLTVIPASAISIAPVQNPLQLSRDPQSLLVTEGDLARFSVQAGLADSRAIEIQWFKNGEPIENAHSLDLRIPRANLEDHGARFAAEIRDRRRVFPSIRSSEAILTVLGDTQAPQLVYPGHEESWEQITLTFDEPVSEVSAENLDNYSIVHQSTDAELTLHTAELSSDGLSVTFTTDQQIPGVYEARVRNITDRSRAGTVMTSDLTYFGKSREGWPLLIEDFPSYSPYFIEQNGYDPIAIYRHRENIDSESVRLTVNGQLVIPSVQEFPQSQNVTYDAPATGWPSFTKIDVSLTHSQGEFTFSFENGLTYDEQTLFVEAEDFDFDGGLYVKDLPIGLDGEYPGGSYTGKGTKADRGTDWEDGGSNSLYRRDLNPGIKSRNGQFGPETHRGRFRVNRNFVIDRTQANEWYNYTRDWPEGRFHIYANLATSHRQLDARLDLVVSGAGTQQQKLLELGTFSGRDLGYERYALLPLLNSSGEKVALDLSGEQTLRFTVLSSPTNYGDPGTVLLFDYLVLAPADPEPPAWLDESRGQPRIAITNTANQPILSTQGVLLESMTPGGLLAPMFSADGELPIRPHHEKAFFRTMEETARIVPQGKAIRRGDGSYLCPEGAGIVLNLEGHTGLHSDAAEVEWFLNGNRIDTPAGRVGFQSADRKSLVISHLGFETDPNHPQVVGTYWMRWRFPDSAWHYSRPIELVAVKSIPLPESLDLLNAGPAEILETLDKMANRLTSAAHLHDLRAGGYDFSPQSFPPPAGKLFTEIFHAQTSIPHRQQLAGGTNREQELSFETSLEAQGYIGAISLDHATWLPLRHLISEAESGEGSEEPSTSGWTSFEIESGRAAFVVEPASESTSVWRALYYLSP
jgi:hypothetical protein